MNVLVPLGILLLAIAVAGPATAQSNRVDVSFDPPPGPFKMGQTPKFEGAVHNVGSTDARGLVVFLSILSVEPGKESPVSLEDWSAAPALRIDALAPGATASHSWTMRLIASGTYGAALTVIDPAQDHPVVSRLVVFRVEPKPILSSARILPVAIGEPVLLLAIAGGIAVARRRQA